jgi:Leucine-rich repeat (LRR) protein
MQANASCNPMCSSLKSVILIEKTAIRSDKPEIPILTSSDQQPIVKLKRLILSNLRARFSFITMTHLENLDIYRFNDLSFPSYNGNHGPFHCLSHLKVLTINRLRINELVNRQNLESGQFFSGLTSLTHLHIFHCQSAEITTIGRHFFKHLSNLKFLELVSDSIHCIEPDAFAPLVNLEHLNLSKNFLTSFPFACLTSHLANLVYLLLGSNQIESLDGLNFNKTESNRLQIIDLRNNKISVELSLESTWQQSKNEGCLFIKK